jgi:hypothetical protein
MQVESLPEPRRSAAGAAQFAGALLLLATVLEIVAMAHHPSFATADIGAATPRIAAAAGTAAWVHGALITLLLLVAWCFAEFCVMVGMRRPLVRAGAIAYSAGVMSMMGAALVSGFVVPEVVRSLSGLQTLDAGVMQAVFILCRVLNRTAANAGVFAMSAGTAAWSVALLRDSGARRLTGILGCLAAVLPTVALLSGAVRLNVFGMGAVVVVQGVWNIAVALLLLRR